jgi:hypothetical protein
MLIENLKTISKQIADFLNQEYYDLDSVHESTQRLIEEAINTAHNSGGGDENWYEIGANFDIKLNVFKFDCFDNKINFETTVEVLETRVIDEEEYEDGTTYEIHDYVRIRLS